MKTNSSKHSGKPILCHSLFLLSLRSFALFAFPPLICSFRVPSATLLLQNSSQMGRVAGQNIVLSRIHWTMAARFVAVNVGYFTRFRLQQRPKLLTWQRIHLKRKIWSQALIAAAPLLMHAGIWKQMSLYSDLWGWSRPTRGRGNHSVWQAEVCVRSRYSRRSTLESSAPFLQDCRQASKRLTSLYDLIKFTIS